MSDILINDVDPRNQYTATALQTTFAYTFPIRSASDLLVYATPSGTEPDDATQILILNVDYTVTGVGVQTGGNVVFTAGAAAGTTITIYRNLPMERQQNYTSLQALDVDSINRDFNNIVMMMQQTRATLNNLNLVYQKTLLRDTKNLKLPALSTNHIWKKTALGIESVELVEDPGATTLRSELANAVSGTDGSRLVGYYSTGSGSTTVHAELEKLTQGNYGVATGAANTYSTAISPAPVAYYNGYNVFVKINVTNTASSTLEVNSLGAKTIQATIEGVLGTLPANSLIAGMIAHFVFDTVTDAWTLINPNITNASGVTGEIRIGWFEITETPSGWMFLRDGTFGDASSGGTLRANADTEALYTYWWEKYSQPSANARFEVVGGIGASAFADFSAHKPMRVPDVNARVFGISGVQSTEPTRGVSTGAFEGASTHTLTIAEMPAHSHTYTRWLNQFKKSGDSADVWEGERTEPTSTVGGGGAHTNLQPSVYMNAMVKL